ncbi:MAG: hypothetical protein ACRC1K_04235 [Planctomycetia bacterium]
MDAMTEQKPPKKQPLLKIRHVAVDIVASVNLRAKQQMLVAGTILGDSLSPNHEFSGVPSAEIPYIEEIDREFCKNDAGCCNRRSIANAFQKRSTCR